MSKFTVFKTVGKKSADDLGCLIDNDILGSGLAK